jgi:ParB family chromosome partitioning protein
MEVEQCVEFEIGQFKLSELEPDENQPRKYFDPDRLKELKESIQANGILIPLLYREDGDKKIIVSGEYRYRAAKILELSTVPARKVLKDHEFIAVSENLNRNDLTAMEKARAVSLLITEDCNQAAVAKRLAFSESYMSEIIKPTELPKYIQEEALKSAFWSNNILLKLAREKNQEKQQELFEKGKAYVQKREDIKKQRREAPQDKQLGKPEISKEKNPQKAIERRITGLKGHTKTFSDKLEKYFTKKWKSEDKEQVREELTALADAINTFLNSNENTKDTQKQIKSK